MSKKYLKILCVGLCLMESMICTGYDYSENITSRPSPNSNQQQSKSGIDYAINQVFNHDDKDQNRLFEYCKYFNEKGNSYAQNDLAYFYVKEYFKNKKYQVEYFKNKDHENVQLEDFKKKNHENAHCAFLLYKQSAENDNIWGKINLAFCYALGFGTEKNDKELSVLLKKLLKKEDNLAATLLLGNCHIFGFGVRKSPKTAFNLFYKCRHKTNNPHTMYTLAYFYKKGAGVKQDETLAEKYYAHTFSAFPSINKSQKELDYLRSVVRPGFAGWHESKTWESRWDGLISLALRYGNFYWSKKDFSKAFFWYKNHASIGGKEAFLILGYLYGKGVGVTRDLVLARKYFQDAFKSERNEVKNAARNNLEKLDNFEKKHRGYVPSNKKHRGYVPNNSNLDQSSHNMNYSYNFGGYVPNNSNSDQSSHNMNCSYNFGGYVPNNSNSDQSSSNMNYSYNSGGYVPNNTNSDQISSNMFYSYNSESYIPNNTNLDQNSDNMFYSYNDVNSSSNQTSLNPNDFYNLDEYLDWDANNLEYIEPLIRYFNNIQNDVDKQYLGQAFQVALGLRFQYDFNYRNLSDYLFTYFQNFNETGRSNREILNVILDDTKNELKKHHPNDKRIQGLLNGFIVN